MRKLVRVILITCTVFFTISVQHALADDEDYHSNGQTSFYGTYIQESDEEIRQQKKVDSPDIKKLPSTGASTNPVYVITGVLLITIVGIKVYSERRKD